MDNERMNELERDNADLRAQLADLKRARRFGLTFEYKPDKAVSRITDGVPYLSPQPGSIPAHDGLPTHRLIKGDNYPALVALLPELEGTVNVIYIDPPYNTGNKDFIYNDRFVDSTDTYRHSTWLSFMKPRLILARRMLSDDGVIFVSIDDHEQAHLRILMDEVFGEGNFVGEIVWQSTVGSNTSTTNIVVVTENIMCYSKSSHLKLTGEKFVRPDNMKMKDEFFGERGFYALDKLDSRRQESHYSESLNYPISIPGSDEELWPGGSKRPNGFNWLWSKSKVEWGIRNGFIVFKSSKNGTTVYNKRYELVDNNGEPTNRVHAFKNLILSSFATSATGTKEFKSIFGIDINGFSYPKPVSIIKRLVALHPNPSALVLDFFAGSGTTLQAVAELNAADNGNRRCVLITDAGKPEETGTDIADDITYERCRRVLTGQDWADGKDHPDLGQGLDRFEVEFVETSEVPYVEDESEPEPEPLTESDILFRLEDALGDGDKADAALRAWRSVARG